MRKGRDIIHLPVVHSATGKTVGRVTDLIVNTREGRVTGLLLAAEGESANRRIDWTQVIYDRDVIRTEAEPAPHDPASLEPKPHDRAGHDSASHESAGHALAMQEPAGHAPDDQAPLSNVPAAYDLVNHEPPTDDQVRHEQAPCEPAHEQASPGEPSPATPVLLCLSRCEGHPVRTQAGRPLGQVGDILFDPAQGQLTAVEVSDGLMQDLLTGRLQLPWPDVTEWRADTVIVADHWQDAWQRE
ncbi:conserved hypothetical protein [Heliomicrobium modesticaldum Ice1]|uniref:PRC-barrel domain-containing protein n=1 Tax=Heliobacterium modesticaldum (strain ATCC 51547 / Ice1) TaxID=498761 RepID=B0TFA8_HELMI|nr:PRC-barrel domain-containing protein [Heliomicrobium modesticaldum]ABZ84425.1 conserved hypothetical protein [Heliomicrobium modesticaldum Ice1]